MNLKIREFELTLESYINNYDLPEEVKRLAIKEIYEKISAKANNSMASEIEERDKTERKKEDEQDI